MFSAKYSRHAGNNATIKIVFGIHVKYIKGCKFKIIKKNNQKKKQKIFKPFSELFKDFDKVELVSRKLKS